jgi:hypothetical protein
MAKTLKEVTDPMEKSVSVLIPGDEHNTDAAQVQISGGNSWTIERNTPTVVPRKVAELLKNSVYPVEVTELKEDRK